MRGHESSPHVRPTQLEVVVAWPRFSLRSVNGLCLGCGYRLAWIVIPGTALAREPIEEVEQQKTCSDDRAQQQSDGQNNDGRPAQPGSIFSFP